MSVETPATAANAAATKIRKTADGVADHAETRIAKLADRAESAARKAETVLHDGVSLQHVVDGLNALGVGPRDVISILQAIKAAGALQADIQVM